MFSKRLRLVISFLALAIVARSQVTPLPTGSPGVIQQPYRQQVTMSFGVPIYPDTPTANLGIAGADSVGLLIQIRSTGILYIRDTVLTGGHVWAAVGVSTGGLVFPNTADKYLNGYGNFATLNTDSLTQGNNKFDSGIAVLQSLLSTQPVQEFGVSSGKRTIVWDTSHNNANGIVTQNWRRALEDSLNANIALKLASALAAGELWIGNSSGQAQSFAVTGDVTFSSSGASTISSNAVTNAKAAQAPATTIKGNPTGSTANEQDMSPATLLAMLPATNINVLRQGQPGDTAVDALSGNLMIAAERDSAGMGVHHIINPDFSWTWYGNAGEMGSIIGKSLTAGQHVTTDPASGVLSTQAEILHTPALLATAAALPSNTYSNGTAGVGATLTATANGALTIDGVAVASGNKVLIKNEATQANNGIYTVTQAGSGSTPYILTRGNYSSVAGNMIAGSHIYVQQGTANASTVWYQETTGTITFGTTSLVYGQIGGGGASVPSAGLVYSTGSALGDASFVGPLSFSSNTLTADTNTTHTTGIVPNYRLDSAQSTDLNKPNLPTTLWNQSNWTSTTGYTYHGATGAMQVSGGHLLLTGGAQTLSTTVGTANSLYNGVVEISGYGGTLLDRVTIVMKYHTGKALISTGSSALVGQYSTNYDNQLSSMMGGIMITSGTGTSTGKATAIAALGTANTTASTSATQITTNQADEMLVTVKRIYDKMWVTVKDVTTDSTPINTEFLYDATNSSNILLPNTGVFAIANMGDSTYIDSINITTDEPKGVPQIEIDSKGAYDCVRGASFNGYMFRHYPSLEGAADPSSGMVDVLKRLPEIMSFNPPWVFTEDFPRNDSAFGIASATFRQYCKTYDSTLTANGITNYWGDGIWETQLNLTPLSQFIYSTFPTWRVVRTLAAGQGVTATVNPVDNIHPTAYGAELAANNVINSGKLADPAQYLNNKWNPQFDTRGVWDSIYLMGGLIQNRVGGGFVFPSFYNFGDIVLTGGTSITEATVLAGINNSILVTNASTGGMEIHLRDGGIPTNSSLLIQTPNSGATGAQATVWNLLQNGTMETGSHAVATNWGNSGDYVMSYNAALHAGTSATLGYNNWLTMDSASDGWTRYHNTDSAAGWAFFQSISGQSRGSQLQVANFSQSGALILSNIQSLGTLTVLTDDPTALLNIQSTNKGVDLPVMPTSQATTNKSNGANIGQIEILSDSMHLPAVNTGAGINVLVTDSLLAAKIAAIRAVDTIWRTPGVDSIKFIINGNTYEILDSVGGSISSSPYIFSQTANGTALTTSTSTTNILGTGTGSATIAANSLSVGQVITIESQAIFSTAESGGTPSFTVGGLIGGEGTTVNATTSNGITNVLVDIISQYTVLSTGSSGTIQGTTTMTVQGQGGFGPYSTAMTSTATINTTTSNAVVLDWTWGSSISGDSIQTIMPTRIKVQ